jgi:hypothetical protein
MNKMEHLSFDIICKIADGEMSQNEIELYSPHWKTCRSCQQEVELQRSIIQVSRRAQLVHPSNNFTQGVLSVIIPPRKKRWYEWLLRNMGNSIAMTSVLAFLLYMFSIIDASSFQNNRSNKIKPVIELMKLIQQGSQQLGHFLTPKFPVQLVAVSHIHTIDFALFAILLLVFIDRIAGRFFNRSKT